MKIVKLTSSVLVALSVALVDAQDTSACLWRAKNLRTRRLGFLPMLFMHFTQSLPSLSWLSDFSQGCCLLCSQRLPIVWPVPRRSLASSGVLSTCGIRLFFWLCEQCISGWNWSFHSFGGGWNDVVVERSPLIRPLTIKVFPLTTAEKAWQHHDLLVAYCSADKINVIAQKQQTAHKQSSSTISEFVASKFLRGNCPISCCIDAIVEAVVAITRQNRSR